MTLQEINKAYNRIIGSLDSKELKNAFDSIQALISGSREISFQDKLNELQDTYKYMLRYRIEGAKDPMQEQIYNKIQTSSYELADRIKHKAMAVESPLAFYSRRRSLQVQPNVTFENLHLQLSKHYATGNRAEYDAMLIVLFNKIWVSDPFTVEDAAVIKNILFDNELPFTAGCQIVSSLTLGLQAAFDPEKMMLLFDAANHGNEEIKVRALISILLTLYTYRKRTALYPQIINRLDALSEVPGFTKAIRTITLRFILARETEKITRKLQNEIIPEMMKLSPKISNKINLKDITPEQLGEEMNPEWENIFADSSLGKKMEEFSELQQEGADVMHSTFVHLKSFPFFRELSNWLLPFTTEHSSFGDRFNQNNGEKQMLDSMTLAAFMCNSDKYSLYFSMMQLPEEAKKMIGRTPGNIVAIRPMKDGVIADFDVTESMLRYFIQKAAAKKGVVTPRIAICVPYGVTEVEKRAIEEAARTAGARDAYLIEEPMAAAIGAGLRVEEPEGNMVVDIGGGTTEIAIISLGGIVTAKSIRIGGDEFDESIVSYVKKTYNLAIGERTAEDVKISIGSTFKDDQEQNMQIRGRDLISGLPKTIEISSAEVRDALNEPINSIVDAIKSTLEKTPPELASDIMENGIMLTGGGALLRGLDKLVKQETGMPVQIAENPLDCVALGTGKSVEDQEIFEKVLMMNARK